ncbi:MAG TPA: hypothetical protein VK607_25115 [Kofleriaceae bacterium]|nr:hypothetical protein [Kofleriaceae bacterium]HMG56803.1 hypothetical protein [Kofleriaceae bacterium]
MQPHEDEADVARRQDSQGHEEVREECHAEGGGGQHAEPAAADAAGERQTAHASSDDPARDAELDAALDAARTERMERRDRDREARGRGRQASRERERVEALRAAVLVFARARLAPLSTEDAAAIAELGDERELTELVDTLAQAESIDDARAVLDAAIAGTRK